MTTWAQSESWGHMRDLSDEVLDSHYLFFLCYWVALSLSTNHIIPRGGARPGAGLPAGHTNARRNKSSGGNGQHAA
eukprot:3579643-Pyramimonas_sp.AAC.2